MLAGDNGIIGIKTCSIATFWTTNPTSVDLGFSSGFHGENPAAECPSRGTAGFDYDVQNNVSCFTATAFFLLVNKCSAYLSVSYLARQT